MKSPVPLYLAVLVGAIGVEASAQSAQSSKSDSVDTQIPIELSAFSVEAENLNEYQATNALGATRLSVPLREVPFNLQVVTREFLEDTMSFGGMALGFGGGANREAVSWMGSVEGKAVRGFNTREFLRNGFLRYSDNGSATIERIEVIKGPTSILDGVTSPGGVINVITKKPNPTKDFTRIKTVYGAPLNRIVANVDYNKRLVSRDDGDAFLTFRLSGGYEQSDYLSKYRHRELENIMPSFLFQFSDKTLFGIQHEYYKVNGERGNEIRGFTSTQRVTDANGLHGDVPLHLLYDVDWNMSWDGPDYSTPEVINDTFASFQHKFTRDLVFNLDYNLHHRKVNWGPNTFGDGVVMVGGLPYWRRSWRNNIRTQEVEGIRANLAYHIKLDHSDHNFVAGFLRQDDSTPSMNDTFLNATGGQLQELFLITDKNPNLSVPTPASLRPDPINLNEILTTSFYLNHHAKWLDGRFITQWGIYHAELDSHNSQVRRPNLTPTRPDVDYTTSKTMPQVGVIFPINENIGLYANYSQSMQGNAGSLDGFDKPFGPTPGEIKEIGAKFDLHDGKVSGTISLFEIIENDRIVFDPDLPNKDNPTADPNLPRGANAAIGELTSTGFDADINFYPIKNFTTVFSYGFKNVEVTDDPDPNKVGQEQNIYKHKFGVFNKYTWTDGVLDGFTANFGAQWKSKRQRSADRFGAPGYERAAWSLQAGLGYTIKTDVRKYKFNFAAKNLFGLAERSSGWITGTRDTYYLDNPSEYMFSMDIEF